MPAPFVYRRSERREGKTMRNFDLFAFLVLLMVSPILGMGAVEALHLAGILP